MLLFLFLLIVFTVSSLIVNKKNEILNCNEYKYYF